MTQEHVLAEEEQMTAARTKQHEEEKHTGVRAAGKRRKEGSKAKSKKSRLCYKAEPATLPPDLPSSSYPCLRRYQVTVLPVSRPPSVNKSAKNKQNC